MTGILAIDPGAKSGYCIIPPDSMRPYDYGQVTLKNKSSAARMREIFQAALLIGQEPVVVIEGPYKIHTPKSKGGDMNEVEKALVDEACAMSDFLEKYDELNKADLDADFRHDLKEKVEAYRNQPTEDAFKIGWKTYYSMGTARGRWEQLVRENHLKLVEVNPRTWQARTVGTGKREEQIKKYKERANQLLGNAPTAPIGDDAAAAICIGIWATIKRRNGSL